MMYTVGPKQSMGTDKVTFQRRKTNGNEELHMLVEDRFGNKRVEQRYELEEVVQDEDQLEMLMRTN